MTPAQQHQFLISNKEYSPAKLSLNHKAVMQTSVWSPSLCPAACLVSQAGNTTLACQEGHSGEA